MSTPEPTRPPVLLTWINDYWKILAAAAVIVLAVGETRWQVKELIDDRAAESAQWKLIRQNLVKISTHQIEIEGMQAHMGPRAVQEYGALKASVLRFERHLERHE